MRTLETAVNLHERLFFFIRSRSCGCFIHQLMQYELQAAARAGNVVALRRALAVGADANKLNHHNGWSALHEAVRAGSTESVEMLLEHGARVSATSAAGTSALHFACHAGSLEIAERIIEADGALIHARDHEGWTPLHSASFAGHAALLLLLVTHGADVEASNIAGERPLMFAIAHNHCVCVALLINFGAVPEVKPEEDLTVEVQTKSSTSSERRLADKLVAGASGGAPASTDDTPVPGPPAAAATLIGQLQQDAAASRSEAAKLLVLVKRLNESLYRSEARVRRYKRKARALQAAAEQSHRADSSTLV